jgi:hypothetical protein
MRRFPRLQDRCQNTIAPGGRVLREKFSSRNENPHGFELPRTLSCRVGRPKTGADRRYFRRFGDLWTP